MRSFLLIIRIILFGIWAEFVSLKYFLRGELHIYTARDDYGVLIGRSWWIVPRRFKFKEATAFGGWRSFHQEMDEAALWKHSIGHNPTKTAGKQHA